MGLDADLDVPGSNLCANAADLRKLVATSSCCSERCPICEALTRVPFIADHAAGVWQHGPDVAAGLCLVHVWSVTARLLWVRPAAAAAAISLQYSGRVPGASTGQCCQHLCRSATWSGIWAGPCRAPGVLNPGIPGSACRTADGLQSRSPAWCAADRGPTAVWVWTASHCRQLSGALCTAGNHGRSSQKMQEGLWPNQRVPLHPLLAGDRSSRLHAR